MKSLSDKFKQKVNFVKPLYRKVKIDKGRTPTRNLFVRVDINNDEKLCGDGVYVKQERVGSTKIDYNVFAIETKKTEGILPGACNSFKEDFVKDSAKLQPRRKCSSIENNVKRIVERKMKTDSKSIQAINSNLIITRIPDTWLRVYPAAQIADESKLSVVVRCAVCQLGITTFLVLWTMIWVFVIHAFEGPFESKVSIEFEKEQNQLVIDLATELRQITPLSPKWKNAIENRIEDERRLTMAAMARGAKLHPGEFWNLSGTFLFMVYVMTALGFGAPVPQTLWGRTCALIYAALAVPSHIYLMVNASTCLVANVESNLDKFKCSFMKKKSKKENSSINRTESPDFSRNSDMYKSPSKNNFRKNTTCILSILSIGRCVPIATLGYYTLGAIFFGVLRGRQPLEVVMFPLQFTTTGGLEHVESIVRVLYGFYVEGAMCLLACALATLRRHSSATILYLSEEYRLFSREKQ